MHQSESLAIESTDSETRTIELSDEALDRTPARGGICGGGFTITAASGRG